MTRHAATQHGVPPRTVVHVSDADVFGGTERAILNVIAGLDRERWRPILYHMASPGAEELRASAVSLGIAVRPLPSAERHGTAALFALASALRRDDAAVVHAHQAWPLSCRHEIAAATLARVPAVVASAQLFIDGPRRARAALWHAVLARCVDRYIAVSQHVAERLRERLGLPAARIRVIPNAVPVGRPARRDVRLRASVAGDPGRPLVLTVARLHAQKGLPYLLRAASAIPDAVFAIAGEGEEREALESLARSLGIAERVRFLGHRRDVAALLAACDVFVLPSLYEGLPLSVLEAMAAGAPVVATDIGGTNEALTNDDTGVLVPPADAAALARAIQALLADRERARRLAAAARQYVRRHHSAAAMADDVGRVYEELLATGGPT